MLITLRYVCVSAHKTFCLPFPNSRRVCTSHTALSRLTANLLNKSRIWQHCHHHEAQRRRTILLLLLLPVLMLFLSPGLPDFVLALLFFSTVSILFLLIRVKSLSLKLSSESPSQNWSPWWPSIPGRTCGTLFLPSLKYHPCVPSAPGPLHLLFFVLE